MQGIGINGRFNPVYDIGTAQIENLYFNNISITAHHPINFQLSNEQHHPPLQGAYIKNVEFTGINAECDRDIWLWGYEGAKLENIRFLNCEFLLEAKGMMNRFIIKRVIGYGLREQMQ